MMQYFGINLLKYLATFLLMSADFRLYNLSNWFKIFILLIELLLNYPTTKHKTNWTNGEVFKNTKLLQTYVGMAYNRNAAFLDSHSEEHLTRKPSHPVYL